MIALLKIVWSIKNHVMDTWPLWLQIWYTIYFSVLKQAGLTPFICSSDIPVVVNYTSVWKKLKISWDALITKELLGNSSMVECRASEICPANRHHGVKGQGSDYIFTFNINIWQLQGNYFESYKIVLDKFYGECLTMRKK